MYQLRYTNDLHVIAQSEDMRTLVRRSDYKIHIWDTARGRVVWQNSPSDRYGDTGVTKKS